MGFDLGGLRGQLRDISGLTRDVGGLFRNVTGTGERFGYMGGSGFGVPIGTYDGRGDVAGAHAGMLRQQMVLQRYQQQGGYNGGFAGRGGYPTAGNGYGQQQNPQMAQYINSLRDDDNVQEVLGSWGYKANGGIGSIFDRRPRASDEQVLQAATMLQNGQYRSPAAGYDDGRLSGYGGNAYQRDLAAAGINERDWEGQLRRANPDRQITDELAHEALINKMRERGTAAPSQGYPSGSSATPRSAIPWLSGAAATPGGQVTMSARNMPADMAETDPAVTGIDSAAMLPAGGLRKEASGQYAQDPQLVMHAQRLLNASVAEGKPLVVDGKFGGETERHTRLYQRSVGITETGVLDATTVDSLERSAKARVRSEAEPEPSVGAGSSSHDIARAQTMMNAITVSGRQLEVNGRYDDATIQHIKALQTQWGHTATGTLDSETMSSLERTASKKLGLPYAEHQEATEVQPSRTPQMQRRAGPYHSPD